MLALLIELNGVRPKLFTLEKNANAIIQQTKIIQQETKFFKLMKINGYFLIKLINKLRGEK